VNTLHAFRKVLTFATSNTVTIEIDQAPLGELLADVQKKKERRIRQEAGKGSGKN
jgi:hypothetical protein